MQSKLNIRDDQVEFTSFSKDVDTLVFTGTDTVDFDEMIFLKALQKFDCRETIRHIKVDVSSNLKTCRFLELFPQVVTLMLQGRSMVTTMGLGHAKSLRKLFINCEKKNKVDLEELETSGINLLEIDGARLGDIAIISRTESIEYLQLTGGEFTEFSTLKQSKIKSLTLVSLKLINITGLNDLSNIDEIWLSNCRELLSFIEINSKVKMLTISACNKFLIPTVAKLQALESLTIQTSLQKFSLTDFVELPRLSNLSLTNCKINTDFPQLLKQESLRKVWISPAKDAFMSKLSELNSLALVCNGRSTFVAGKSLPVATFYE